MDCEGKPGFKARGLVKTRFLCYTRGRSLTKQV